MRVGDWDVSIRSLISLKWENSLPRLVLHEKFEKHARWTARTIAAIAVLSSIIAFRNWYTSLLFAVLMFLLEQFVERCVFQYTTIYVQPLPDFGLDTEDWKAMVFAFPTDDGPPAMNIVGCAFGTRGYAHAFFDVLRKWNYGQDEDRENNICLSFILVDEMHYVTYLYPSMDRHTVGATFDAVGKERELEKYGKQHQCLVMQVALGKKFPYGSDALGVFLEKQHENRPYLLAPFLMHEDGTFEAITDEKPVLKHHFKFREKAQLKRCDPEFGFLSTKQRESACPADSELP